MHLHGNAGLLPEYSIGNRSGDGSSLGHTNLMFCFTSTPTLYFAKMTYKCKLVGVVSKERMRTYTRSLLALWSWLSFAALVLSICVWFVAPDMVDLLWVNAEVKWGSVVLYGFWLVCVKIKIPTSIMIFIAYVYQYNQTYQVTLTANPTRETKHQIVMALRTHGTLLLVYHSSYRPTINGRLLADCTKLYTSG